jgi:hypothetical protein
MKGSAIIPTSSALVSITSGTRADVVMNGSLYTTCGTRHHHVFFEDHAKTTAMHKKNIGSIKIGPHSDLLNGQLQMIIVQPFLFRDAIGTNNVATTRRF